MNTQRYKRSFSAVFSQDISTGIQNVDWNLTYRDTTSPGLPDNIPTIEALVTMTNVTDTFQSYLLTMDPGDGRLQHGMNAGETETVPVRMSPTDNETWPGQMDVTLTISRVDDYESGHSQERTTVTNSFDLRCDAHNVECQNGGGGEPTPLTFSDCRMSPSVGPPGTGGTQHEASFAADVNNPGSSSRSATVEWVEAPTGEVIASDSGNIPAGETRQFFRNVPYADMRTAAGGPGRTITVQARETSDGDTISCGTIEVLGETDGGNGNGNGNGFSTGDVFAESCSISPTADGYQFAVSVRNNNNSNAVVSVQWTDSGGNVAAQVADSVVQGGQSKSVEQTRTTEQLRRALGGGDKDIDYSISSQQQ